MRFPRRRQSNGWPSSLAVGRFWSLARVEAKVKARAVVLAEAALLDALVGELQQCLEYGSLAATPTGDLDFSIAAELLYEIVPIVLPYSDTRAVRELLPQLTRVNRTADLEDEAEQK